MLVRIFFSFSSESDEELPFSYINMCENIRKEIIRYISPHKNDFTHYFYKEKDKNFINNDHFQACNTSNYFIILFFGDSYLNSDICASEWNIFQKNETYPKTLFIVVEHKYCREQVDSLANLERFEYLPKSKLKYLEDIKSPNEVFSEKEGGVPHKIFSYDLERRDLRPKDIIEDELSRIAAGIGEKLLQFRNSVRKELEKQIRIGGSTPISDEKRETY